MDETKARERLEQERERLQAMARSIAEDNDLEEGQQDSAAELSNVDQHVADAGSETFEREKDMAILANLEEQIDGIEEALKRVADGTYGTCEACGKAIGDERLEVVPTARYCVEDQGAREAG